ncbi:C40 family peptidase [Kitasatospora purpeofusca]|uniref:C40 family peptidase n=1 Tax=Kitasatospora purpeofusca TaxID=67352 RepID=UPI0030F32791
MRIASGTDVGLAFVDGTADGFDGFDEFDELDGFDADRGFEGLDAPDGFEERLGGPAIADCGCPHCAARPRTAPSARPSGAGRIHRAVRTACLATTVLAGAGVVGLTAGAGAAQAAPGKQGWDGSKYWFKNARGEWRWTGHYSVYVKAVGASGSSPSAGGSSAAVVPTGSTGSTGPTGSTAQPVAPEAAVRSAGPRQGWDGSRYWFRNARGEWRWTSHYDIYLDRTGGSGGGTQTQDRTPSADRADARAESVIGYALAQLGKPYVWGGDGPSGYDCSGLVQQAFRRAGVQLPRVADDQYAATTPITQDRLRRGDLLFWSDSGRASGIHHVGIYLGGGKFVEAPRPGKTVRVSVISSGFRPTHFGRP